MRNFNHEMAIQTLRIRSEASTLSRIGERWRVRAGRVSVPTPQTAGGDSPLSLVQTGSVSLLTIRWPHQEIRRNEHDP